MAEEKLKTSLAFAGKAEKSGAPFSEGSACWPHIVPYKMLGSIGLFGSEKRSSLLRKKFCIVGPSYGHFIVVQRFNDDVNWSLKCLNESLLISF